MPGNFYTGGDTSSTIDVGCRACVGSGLLRAPAPAPSEAPIGDDPRRVAGAWLREFRVAGGRSLRETADFFHISAVRLGEFERGIMRAPVGPVGASPDVEAENARHRAAALAAGEEREQNEAVALRAELATRNREIAELIVGLPTEEEVDLLATLRGAERVEGSAFLDGDKFCPQIECDTFQASWVFVPFCKHDTDTDGDRRATLLLHPHPTESETP